MFNTNYLNTYLTVLQNDFTNEMIQEAAFAASTDKHIFHDKTGTLIKLSNGRRTAERKRPLDEFNNGVVMTNRAIRDDEMFEVWLSKITILKNKFENKQIKIVNIIMQIM